MIEPMARRKAWLRHASAGLPLPAALAFVFVTALIALIAGVPYLFQGETLETEVAAQVRATVGLSVSSTSVGRLELLPRPRIAVDGLRVADPTGTLSIDADELVGDIRLLPLIVGRIELSSATLIKPRLVINLDGAPIRPDSIIGRAVRAETTGGARRLGVVTLVGGSAIVKGGNLAQSIHIDDLDTTLDWRDLDSPATLTGAFGIGGLHAELAAWFAQPSNLMRGDHSAVALHIRTPHATLSANGDLAGHGAMQFRGHVSATAPSGSALLALAGSNISLVAPFANLSLDSDASLAVDADARTALDLQNLAFRADGNAFEGTLAVTIADHTSVAATLATDQLNLAPFLRSMPDVIDKRHRWSTDPLVGRDPHMLDLDMRVSASHLRLAPFLVDDAALAVITREGRTEIALIEGKTYGGQAKARLSIGLSRDDMSLRGSGSLMDADAATLTWDAFGQQLATGKLSGTANLETEGDSAAALVRHVRGWAKVNAADGEISNFDMGRGLSSLDTNPALALAQMVNNEGRTSFSTLSCSARIGDGIATLEDGVLQGREGELSLEGTASLPTRTFDLRALVRRVPESGAAAQKPTKEIAFRVKGPFDRPQVSLPPPSK